MKLFDPATLKESEFKDLKEYQEYQETITEIRSCAGLPTNWSKGRGKSVITRDIMRSFETHGTSSKGQEDGK